MDVHFYRVNLETYMKSVSNIMNVLTIEAFMMQSMQIDVTMITTTFEPCFLSEQSLHLQDKIIKTNNETHDTEYHQISLNSLKPDQTQLPRSI